MSNELYPGNKGWRRIKKNVRFCLWGVTNAHAVKVMQTLFTSQYLSPVLKSEPHILEKPLKPYLCINWTRAERLKHIQDHFLFLQNIFGANVSKIFENDGYDIFEFYDSNDALYHVKLYAGASREGSLGLQLKDAKNQTIYSLTCNLSLQGKKVLYIGSVQGPSQRIENRHDIIKLLTRSVHGLRTKAMMLEFALMLARILDMDEVQGISNKAHIYQALRYIGSKRKSVTFDYDDLWIEYGAASLNKYFYRVPINPLRKDPQSLKKAKRRLYVKRYLWLANAEQIIAERISELSTSLYKIRKPVLNGQADDGKASFTKAETA